VGFTSIREVKKRDETGVDVGLICLLLLTISERRDEIEARFLFKNRERKAEIEGCEW
jgi:hypothetical protein